MTGPPGQGDGGRLCQAPATVEKFTSPHHGADVGHDSRAIEQPADSAEGLAAVVAADDDALDDVLKFDVAVRRALRDRPADGEIEQARSLVAAARVERRRRRSAGDVLGQVLAAAKGCR